jgi:hypothetical protein
MRPDSHDGQHGRTQLQRLNLLGIGFGAKETAAKLTGDLAVRLYVSRKFPRQQLSAADRIPEFVNGIPTDVIVIGKPRFHSDVLKLGAGISHASGGRGSLGCIVRKPGDEGWYMLSACHVLAPPGVAQLGDVIIERSGPNEAGEPIATLVDFEPLKADGSPNMFDAAMARLNERARVLPTIPLIGVPQAPIIDAFLYQSVRKFGAETLGTIGVVVDPMFDTEVTLSGETYSFLDIVVVAGAGEEFSQGGDSGALAVDAITNRPVGLIMGGGVGPSPETVTFLSPIRAVLQRFGVQLLQ